MITKYYEYCTQLKHYKNSKEVAKNYSDDWYDSTVAAVLAVLIHHTVKKRRNVYYNAFAHNTG